MKYIKLLLLFFLLSKIVLANDIIVDNNSNK